jgi:hypothetical protein
MSARIETMQDAGSQKWGVMVDGMLDTDSLGYATEDGATNYALAKYPHRRVITTQSPHHYSRQHVMKVECTDTFNGEANYSWVHRNERAFNDTESDYALVRRAKKLMGYNGVRCRKEQLGETLALYPQGQCVVIFITFH